MLLFAWSTYDTLYNALVSTEVDTGEYESPEFPADLNRAVSGVGDESKIRRALHIEA